METIYVDAGNPPFMYELNDKAEGIYPIILKEIFDSLQMPVSIKPVPWKRAIEYADFGVAGIAGIYKNEERLKKYDYSDEIYKEKILIYVLKEKMFSFKHVSDLKGKSIGVLMGWSYGEEFDKARNDNLFTAYDATLDEINFKHLLSNKLDCILAIEETGSIIKEKNSKMKSRIVSLDTPLLVNSTYLIFPKSLNKNDVLFKFNSKLNETKKNGKYKRLINDFLNSNMGITK